MTSPIKPTEATERELELKWAAAALRAIDLLLVDEPVENVGLDELMATAPAAFFDAAWAPPGWKGAPVVAPREPESGGT